MARREYNGASVATTLSGDITSSSLSIALTDGSSFPTGTTGPFVVDIDTGLSGYEKILVTSRSSNTLTVASTADRGYDGTSAAAHVTTAAVRHVISAVDLDEANAHINNAGTVKHTSAAMAANSIDSAHLAAGAVDNTALAASGLDISKMTVGTGSRPTTGSAATLTTGRTISLTGDITGTSGSFDGSGNVSIATSVTAVPSAWSTYTPTISGWGIGNGSIPVANYVQIGPICFLELMINWGSTSTFGSFLQISYPIAPSGGHGQRGLDAIAFGPTGAEWALQTQYGADISFTMATDVNNKLPASSAMSGSGPSTPFTWVSGARIYVHGWYAV